MRRRRVTMSIEIEDLGSILRGDNCLTNIGPDWEVLAVDYDSRKDALIVVFAVSDAPLGLGVAGMPALPAILAKGAQ
jgi:hypothetical protein